MDRGAFLKTCGLACLGAGYMVTFLESCASVKRLTGTIDGSDLVIPVNSFEVQKKNGVQYLKAVMVQHSQLQDPVCVFRADDGQQFNAILMRCTHQGAQLQLFGDKLQCPAHGSEFDSQGQVRQGPAETNLRAFAVSLENQQLRISLR